MATEKANGKDKKKEETTALSSVGATALAVPSFIKEGDRRGTENITSADIRPPGLRIAQGMSPEVKRNNAAYIEGLVEGTFFDSITKEIYGEGPLDLVIVNQLGHRHVEFAPMSEGGGVVDFNVEDGDPRTEFTTAVKDGKKVRVPPVATKFYDYLVIVTVPSGLRKLMTLSLKSTQLKKAVTLNTILLGSKLPSFAHLFKVEPVSEQKGAFNFYGWKIEAAGYVTEEVYNEASATYDAMQGKKITVETEETAGLDPDRDDKTPF